MRLTGPILAFASLAAGQDFISGLSSAFGGLTSDLPDGASVITSAVANRGDAFETITSNIAGGIETDKSNIDGAFATATSRVVNALNVDDDDNNDNQDDISSTSGERSSQNAAPTALPFVEAGFIAAGVALGVMV
jgi:hypothetical protein